MKNKIIVSEELFQKAIDAIMKMPASQVYELLKMLEKDVFKMPESSFKQDKEDEKQISDLP